MSIKRHISRRPRASHTESVPAHIESEIAVKTAVPRSPRSTMWNMMGKAAILMALMMLFRAGMAWAQTDGAGAAPAFKADKGDTAWMLASSALVLLMTPGLAFFYGGLVRSKNMLNTLMMSFGAMAVLGIAWIIIGYSIAFGTGNDFVGDASYAFLNGVGVNSGFNKDATIPHQLFMIFQGMFFIITPALISGSLIERMKFSTFMVYMLVWGLVVYCPVAHWVWGGGWIGKMGVMDFAGGAVVHVNAGFAALAATLVLGARRGYNKVPMLPHSLPLCLLGVGLLWFGWFGFNAGSALGSGELATVAFVNTQIGAAAAMLTWMLIDQITRKEMTALGAGTGAVAGLVGITPACGFVSPMGALLVGAITSAVCYGMATLRAKNRVDDSLDAFAVHGVGGFTGAVLTGVFSDGNLGVAKTIKDATGLNFPNASGVNTLALPGLLQGGTMVFVNQIIATAAVAIFTFVMSFLICTVLKAVMGLRVSEESEERGLDVSLHGEEAYASAAIG